MEKLLELPVTTQPIPENFAVNEPAIDSARVTSQVKSPESDEWKRECERGLADIWRIGKARLKTLGLE